MATTAKKKSKQKSSRVPIDSRTSKLTLERRRAPDETAGGGACARAGTDGGVERACCGDGGIDESGDEVNDEEAIDDEMEAPVDGCADGNIGGTVSALSSALADVVSVLALRALLLAATLAIGSLSGRVTIDKGRGALSGTGCKGTLYASALGA